MELHCLLLICVNNLIVVKPLPPWLLVFGEILLNKMWLSHTCPPFLSAGWNVNTSIGDSVLAPVFTEREINKLLNLKACILSSSRVHFGQGCQVFSCLWPSFEMTSCLRKTPSISPHHLFLRDDSKVCTVSWLLQESVWGRGRTGEHV